MIPLLIHQIYWDFKGNDDDMKPLWKEYGIKLRDVYYNFKHVDWGKKETHDLVSSLMTPDEYEFFCHLPPIMQTDFARYAILYTHGGIYFDRDILVSDKTLEKLLTDYDIKTLFFAESGVNENGVRYIGNAAMACEKGSLIMKSLLDHSVKKLEIFKDKNNFTNNDILYGYGPHYLSIMLKRLLPSTDIVIPISVLKNIYEKEDIDLEMYIKNGVCIIPPESLLGFKGDMKGYFFGIHGTHGSWKV